MESSLGQQQKAQSTLDEENSLPSPINRYKRTIIGLLVLVPVVGILGFGVGMLSASPKTFWNNVPRSVEVQSLEIEALSSPTVTPSPEGTSPNEHLEQSLSEEQVDSLLLERAALGPGYSQGPDNPEIELFVFADFTEKGFSGSFLTENITAIQRKYGDQVRTWYVHSILPYRENSNLLAGWATMTCVANQGTIWDHMENLVVEDGDHTFAYQVSDPERYRECITATFADDKFNERSIAQSNERMENYGIPGLPTVVFISLPSKKTATVVGALPVDLFEERVEEILAEL